MAVGITYSIANHETARFSSLKNLGLKMKAKPKSYPNDGI